ncbi:hypothetical protein PTTG_25272 [Puccinia triticina 1-1 BBBD Race 1]|uniref:Uncharacterized protein n=1 Tax=Puccinia triticina (isolate 1-1 / race 1 (BBBD)) TaxID=630390 RepID=A0A180H4L1_PUCT1|nr:hypothetical protein PTTG_25272 [Puccinia triticina 1-1 BBBD Race 1]
MTMMKSMMILIRNSPPTRAKPRSQRKRKKVLFIPNPKTMSYVAPGFRYPKIPLLEPIKKEALSGNKFRPCITKLCLIQSDQPTA